MMMQILNDSKSHIGLGMECMHMGESGVRSCQNPREAHVWLADTRLARLISV